ncbi:unnamed protein product [Linum trigynum]|uniref:Uncharacterized protein n=1 Tax=Linum trigynum TaxID=586398 RepID=A0AAV2DYN4_9ROSI
MEHTLLCNLAVPRKSGVALRLRLLHMWPAKSPSDVRVFNYCTLWVDETGTLIQGLSPPSMAAAIPHSLHARKIYVVKSFGLGNPPNLYRACSFDLSLGVTPATSFQECALPSQSFPVDSFEFLPFESLSTRAGDHRFLTDIVGRLHSISGVSHKITNNGPTVKQTVVVEDESGEKATVTLWDEFSQILDHVALTQADAIETVILAFGGLLVNKLGNAYVLSSSAATRIAVNPSVPKAYHLVARFAERREGVCSLPVEFATAVAAAEDATRQTKTLAQLRALSQTNASLEERHRCSGVIVDVEENIPCYKIQLTLRDNTSDARFIAMGGCGHALANISAAYLAQRFPYRPGQLPPQLQQLRGQYVQFDCRLPLPGPAGLSSGEFRVSQVVPINDPIVVAGLIEHPPQLALPAPIQIVPQATPSVSLGVQSSEPYDIGASSSRLSREEKGKGKCVDSPLIEASTPAFCIGSQPIPASSVFDSALADATGHLQVQLPQNLQPAPPPVAPADEAVLAVALPATSALPQQGSVAVGAIDSPNSGQLLAPGNSAETRDVNPPLGGVSVKVLKTDSASSPGKVPASVPTSPSASLFLSPPAKIKVEKLDDNERSTPESCGSQKPFNIGIGGDSLEVSKKTSSKRSLFKG